MLKVFQHNCRKSPEALVACLESALQDSADVVLLQEPPVVSQERYRQRHPGFNIVFAQRTATAFRVNTRWKWTARTDLDAVAEGDAQVWDLQRGTARIRIANVYDQIRQSDGSRPSRFINWTEVINSRTVVAGDFNAHSRRWNPLLNAPARNHRYLEDFIDTHALSPVGDGEATCFSPNATNYSVIDLVLVTQEIADNVNTKTMNEDAYATGSDHHIIRWTLEGDQGSGGTNRRIIRGWAISKALASEETREKMKGSWHSASGRYPSIDDNCTTEDLERQVVWLRTTITSILDQHAKKITITARSKRWWNELIDERRTHLGRMRRWHKEGKVNNSIVALARQTLRKEIRASKKKMWEDFIQLDPRAGSDVWTVLNATKDRPNRMMGKIVKADGTEARTDQEKRQLMVDVSFPPPNQYDGGEGAPGPPGSAHTRVNQKEVGRALFAQSSKKAPGIDNLGFLIIKEVWKWEPERISAIARQAVRLQYHPSDWKTAKGVPIPKPGKPDYTKAKAYRVISLLSCLGKVVEKVTANLIAEAAERLGGLHQGQFGGRKKRSAMEAAATVIIETEAAWREGEMMGALMMDVKGAFPTVNRQCLIKKMREMGIDEDLAGWTSSFMTNREAVIEVNGENGEPIQTDTGLPQGSPTSPILFLIYIADLGKEVEEAHQGTIGLSFVDDVTWLVRGKTADQVARKLERCATMTLGWAQRNAVTFETEKTEAILFTRKRNLMREVRQNIKVGTHSVKFSREAVRWLGVWLDAKLTLKHHHQTWTTKARRAQARINRLCRSNGLPPGSVKALQTAVVQAVALYGIELQGIRGKPEPRVKTTIEQVQRIVNAQARATLGCFPSTPVGILMAESGMTPATAMAKGRAHRFLVNAATKPGKGTLKSFAKARLSVQEVEETLPKEGLELRGIVHVQEQENAETTAFGWDERERLTFWTDGSRQDDKSVGAAVVWLDGENGTYQSRGTYLGRNKEIGDAELFALGEAVKHAARHPEDARDITVFTDSQATLTRIQDDNEGPGQALARRIIAWEKEVFESGRTIEYRWCPGHAGVPGNEEADRVAKAAAAKDTSNLSEAEIEMAKWTSMSHLHRQSTDLRRNLRNDWVREQCKDHRQYVLRKKTGLRKELEKCPKRSAAVFYQLLSGHARVGKYLKRIGKTIDPSCGFCQRETEQQTREHLFNRCTYWARERKQLYRNLNLTKKFRHSRITRMKVAKLFSEECATNCILGFLKDTQVGRRQSRRQIDDHDWGGDEFS
jgi:ribonuclease HI